MSNRYKIRFPDAKCIHYRREKSGRVSTDEVKDGFNWMAFFFGPLWAWSNGLFRLGILLLAVIFAANVAAAIAAALVPTLSSYSALFGLGVSVWIGFKAKKWRQQQLRQSGYVEISPDPVCPVCGNSLSYLRMTKSADGVAYHESCYDSRTSNVVTM